MLFLKKSFVGLSAALLMFILFSFGLVWSVYQVLGTPDSLKRALRSSGIYETGVASALQQAEQEQAKKKAQQQNQGPGAPEEEGIPVGDPTVAKIIQSAVPPTELRTQVETVLDGAYAWVQGKTPSLNFAIDLTGAKQRLAEAMGTYIEQHLAAQPACTAAEMPKSGEEFDPFSANCLPPGTNPGEAAAKMREQIMGGEFLKDPVINAGSIKMDNGQTIDQKFARVPELYQQGKMALYVLGAIGVLCVIAIVFLSATWRNGLRRAGIMLAVMGALTLLVSWLSRVGVAKAVEALGKEAGQQPLQQTAGRIGELLARDFSGVWMAYGLVLLIVGAVAIAAVYFTQPRDIPLAHPGVKHAGHKPRGATPAVTDEKSGDAGGDDTDASSPSDSGSGGADGGSS